MIVFKFKVILESISKVRLGKEFAFSDEDGKPAFEISVSYSSGLYDLLRNINFNKVYDLEIEEGSIKFNEDYREVPFRKIGDNSLYTLL